MKNIRMKSILVLLVSVFMLSACRPSSDDQGFPYPINMEEITQINVNTYNQGTTVELDEKWTKIIGVIDGFSYKKASTSQVEELWALGEADEDFYGIILVCDEIIYSFLLFDDIIVANYIDLSLDDKDQPTFYITKDKAIETLQDELAEIKFPMAL